MISHSNSLTPKTLAQTISTTSLAPQNTESCIEQRPSRHKKIQQNNTSHPIHQLSILNHFQQNVHLTAKYPVIKGLAKQLLYYKNIFSYSLVRDEKLENPENADNLEGN